MSLSTFRQKAINLRLQGKTYSEIKRELMISKSTLSSWLSDLPLSEKQLNLIRKSQLRNKDLSIEKIRITKSLKRNQRLDVLLKRQQEKYSNLTVHDLNIAGLFLYLGEGNKNLKSSVSIANTDSNVIKFALYWYTQGLKVPRDKIKILLHLYSDMSVVDELNYWSKELNIPLTQFGKPYIKNSTRTKVTHKGFGHGTCTIIVNDTRLKEEIIMSIKAITEWYCSGIMENIKPGL